MPLSVVLKGMQQVVPDVDGGVEVSVPALVASADIACTAANASHRIGRLLPPTLLPPLLSSSGDNPAHCLARGVLLHLLSAARARLGRVVLGHNDHSHPLSQPPPEPGSRRRRRPFIPPQLSQAPYATTTSRPKVSTKRWKNLSSDRNITTKWWAEPGNQHPEIQGTLQYQRRQAAENRPGKPQRQQVTDLIQFVIVVMRSSTRG